MTNPNPYLLPEDVATLISFSGGRTSAYLLRMILNAYGGKLPDNCYVAFANTGKERKETLDFVQRVGSEWGVDIVWLEFNPDAPFETLIVNHNSASRNGEPFEAVIRKKQFLPNPVTRFCTIVMKIMRFRAFMRDMMGFERWNSVVGLRFDEKRRVAKQMRRNALKKDIWSTTFPLFDAKVTKRHVADFWRMQPFDLALPNVNGSTPWGNCDLCLLKSAKTIAGLIRERPEAGIWWRDMETLATELAEKPDGARWRIDRPTYGQMLELAARQGDIVDPGALERACRALGYEYSEENDHDCACTD